ncbi:hypothetical protein HYALB_00012225 [Hymenoscyphus albidus]|uniref:Uncharacterized protein n=1 Tax=Hymenoscyphus albidus TaxID=595503 RepID=A0A9N9LS31_9HELO|nr:hypothetical protein HYALB_00012225 [Hymenoscyphus albidus]
MSSFSMSDTWGLLSTDYPSRRPSSPIKIQNPFRVRRASSPVKIRYNPSDSRPSSPIKIRIAREVAVASDSDSDTVSVGDEIDNLGSATRRLVKLRLGDVSKDLLKTLPKKVRHKIWEYYMILECSPGVSPRDVFLTTLLPALEISPTVYQDALEYYFDQFMVTVTLEECDSLKYIRPTTIALMKHLHIYSHADLWGVPNREAAKTFIPFPSDYPPFIKHTISPPLQLSNALHLRSLYLSFEPTEMFARIFLDRLLPPKPTPLRTLHLRIRLERGQPPYEYGKFENRDASRLFEYVKRKLNDMYPVDGRLAWFNRRDWSCMDEDSRGKIFASDKWSLTEDKKDLPDGPLIGDTILTGI